MPEIPFAALDQFQHYLSELMFLLTLTDFCRQTFGGLIQHCEPHRKMKPIEQMFGFRAQIKLQVAYVLAAVREEDNLLIFLHPCDLSSSNKRRLDFVSNVWTKAKHLLDSSSTSCSRRNDRMLLPTITSKCPSLCCARMNPPSIPTASGPSGIGNEFRSC